ncbi:hypothetical protein F5B19DRAFT_45784 [Rostrohypoxylon terebratum]|nr:hypothetical protein F5B19DRAFT_45784 [Rostrohypoxylon terebratum]
MDRNQGPRNNRYLSRFYSIAVFAVAAGFVNAWGLPFLEGFGLKWGEAPKAPEVRQIPLITDISGVTAPFWEGYQTLFDDYNLMAPLFSDVAANSKIIETMMDALPLSREAGTEDNTFVFKHLARYKRRINNRQKYVDNAKEAFLDYVSLRHELLRKSLSNKVIWHWYSDNAEEVKFLSSLTGNKAHNMTESWFEAAEIARYSALQFFEVFQKIWNHENAGGELGKYLALMNENLASAIVHEDAVVQGLAAKSPKGHLWSYRQTSRVLRRLKERVVALQGAHINIQIGLIRINFVHENMPGIDNGFASYRESAAAWAHGVDAMLTGWEKFLFRSDLGVLFATRREHLKATNKTSADEIETSWEAWKGRNCGGTSCYEESDEFSWFWKWYDGPDGPALADRTLDENALCKKSPDSVFKTPKVALSVYDQVCCQETPTTLFVKYAPVDTLTV